jgi:putative ABC transport system permease protein
MGVSAGTPLFPGDAGLIIGEGLARKLGVSLIDAETAWVNLMAQSVEQGISLASFAVVGITDTGVPQQDEGLVIVSREAGLDFLGLGNTASVVEVRLEDEADQADCIASITEAMEQRHRRIEIKDWMDLNPSFAQIDALNQVQYTILTAILCVLVFTSLIQALSAAFKERLPEFGMLEAVGLRKGAIAFLLITEVVFMSLIALAIGLFASWGIAHLVSILNIKLYFPGYSTGYTLFFLFTPVDMALGAAFVFTACMLAMFGPLFPMLRFSVAHLMYHSV